MDIESTFDATDRYEALGIPYPDPETVCEGDCEGTGFVPVPPPPGRWMGRGSGLSLTTEPDPRLVALWEAAEQENPLPPTDIGWHFVRCPDCDGTGRRRGG